MNPAPVHGRCASALAHRLNAAQEPALGVEQAAHIGGRAGQPNYAPTSGDRLILNRSCPGQRQHRRHRVQAGPGVSEQVPPQPRDGRTGQHHPGRASPSLHVQPQGQQPGPAQRREREQQDSAEKAHPRRAGSTRLQTPGDRSKQGRQHHGSLGRAHQRPHRDQTRLNTSEPLVPPKPKLFFSAVSIFISRATLAQ